VQEKGKNWMRICSSGNDTDINVMCYPRIPDNMNLIALLTKFLVGVCQLWHLLLP
jgi:hypothetical protein